MAPRSVPRSAAALIHLILAACGGGAMAPTVEDQLLAHGARNAELLGWIEREGASLDHTREVDLFFYAESPECAREIEARLEGAGFVARVVAPDAKVRQWATLSQALLSARDAGSPAFTERMVRLAADCGGVYDGWGTQL